MADLTTTITESVTINGAARGSTNTVTTTGIVDTRQVRVVDGMVVVVDMAVVGTATKDGPWREIARTRPMIS